MVYAIVYDSLQCFHCSTTVIQEQQWQLAAQRLRDMRHQGLRGDARRKDVRNGARCETGPLRNHGKTMDGKIMGKLCFFLPRHMRMFKGLTV